MKKFLWVSFIAFSLMIKVFVSSVVKHETTWIKHSSSPQYFALYARNIEQSAKWYKKSLWLKRAIEFKELNQNLFKYFPS